MASSRVSPHRSFAVCPSSIQLVFFHELSTVYGRTAGIGRVTGTEVSMDTSDILDKLEIGAMIRGETLHESGWGLMVDYAFMRVGDDFSLPLGGIADATLRQG
jgi:hypothetical protein